MPQRKRKKSLRSRLVDEYTKVSKTAKRDPKNWKEVAERMRWERLRKILGRRYDYLPRLQR